ncbi:sugar ABC transporter substrate-binding protein [bacterium]|nr:sugar ABC transporter substrate-binding protein [bacterium]
MVWVRRLVWTLLALLLLAAVYARSGITRRFRESIAGRSPRATLYVWDWWTPSMSDAFARYFDEVERAFEQAHPGVDVVYRYVPFEQYEQKMATALVGQHPPDVFQCSVIWAEGFYDRGMLRPLNDYLDRDRRDRQRRQAAGQRVEPGGVIDRESFLATAWRHNTKPDGTVFGIPQILDANALIWNLDILERAAATDPEIRGMFERQPDGSVDWRRLRFEAVRDWDQFRRIARKLTVADDAGRPARDGRGDEVQTGFVIHAHGSGSYPFTPWLAANGGDFQDATGTRALFAGDAGSEAVQYVLDLYWNDQVSPAFRRQLTDAETFEQRRAACMIAGTWSGKYIVRNTEGWTHFDKTAFPPGPRGRGPATLTWGNMLVIPRRSAQPDLAWEYVKFITSLEGSLRLLRTTGQNSPRRDFYDTPEWQEQIRVKPYLHNVAAICASGRKLQHTQFNAIDHATRPVFETILLRYPDIATGRGPYPSVAAGLTAAAAAADRVYERYQRQVAEWGARER